MKKDFIEIFFDLEKINNSINEIEIGYYIFNDKNSDNNEYILNIEEFKNLINKQLEVYEIVKLYHFGKIDYDKILKDEYINSKVSEEKIKFIDIQKIILEYISIEKKFQISTNKNIAISLGIRVDIDQLHKPYYDSYISAQIYKKINELKSASKDILISHLHLSKLIYTKVCMINIK